MRKTAPCIASALLFIGSATTSHAAGTAYSDKAAFLTAVPGPASTLDFESLAPGADLSGASVTVGSVSITFPLEVDDVAGDPGDKLNLRVVDDVGDNPTTSPTQSLGVDDIGNFDTLIAGCEIPLTFSPPASSVGLSLITPEAPGTLLFDDDVQLVVPGEATALLTLSDGQFVGNFDGDDYYEYFLGVVSTNPVTTATLSYDVATPDGSFLFNVDDVVIVPEPGGVLQLLVGSAGLFLMTHRRRLSRERQRGNERESQSNNAEPRR